MGIRGGRGGRAIRLIVVGLVAVALLPATASPLAMSAALPPEQYHRCGVASWFAARRSVAVHGTLPMGLTVRVRNIENGASVSVVINGRAHIDLFADRRVIAISSEAFAVIAPLAQGIAEVCVSSA